MVWNKDLPAGGIALNQGDDAIRANNAALETGLSKEHTFATGGAQDLRHVFDHDTTANLQAESEYLVGALAFATNISGYTDPVPYWKYDTGASDWHYGLSDETLTIPNDWTAGQYGTPKALTAGAHISSDLADANVFTVTLDQDSTLDDPSDIASYSGKSGTWYYIITQDSTARTLTLDTSFKGSPVISDVTNSINVLRCVLDANGDLQAEFMPRDATATVPGIVELATDDEAVAGSDATVCVTPHSLGQSFDSSWAQGYFEVIGTGSGGNPGIIVQWRYFNNSSTPTTITWATAFASANYVVTASYEDSGRNDYTPAVSNRTTTTCQIYAETEKYIHVHAIGLKAP